MVMAELRNGSCLVSRCYPDPVELTKYYEIPHVVGGYCLNSVYGCTGDGERSEDMQRVVVREWWCSMEEEIDRTSSAKRG